MGRGPENMGGTYWERARAAKAGKHGWHRLGRVTVTCRTGKGGWHLLGRRRPKKVGGTYLGGEGRKTWLAPIGERAEFDGLGDFNAEFD